MEVTGAAPATEPVRPTAPDSTRGRSFWEALEAYKNRIDAIHTVITIAAVFLGGFWTYRLFVQQRQDYPRLKVEHQIQHWRISKNQVLLSVDEVLSNTGPVLLKLRSGTIRVIQVVPPPAAVAKRLSDVQNLPQRSEAELSIENPEVWDVLVDSDRKWDEGDISIEPGESDVVPNEFIIPANMKVVAVYSFISNPKLSKDRLGWNGLTYYDLEKSTIKPSESKDKR